MDETNLGTDWGRACATGQGEDALLLRESVHRTANEVTAAIAALRLVKAAPRSGMRDGLIEDALLRLEGFATVHRLLAHRPANSVNVGAELEQLCRALLEGRRIATEATVTLSTPDLWLDGATARRLLLVAAELVANSVRHSLAPGGDRLHVALIVDVTNAVLTVADGGPGPGSRPATEGTGLGTGIVDDLIRAGGGGIERRHGANGMAVRVELPLDMRAMARVRSRG